MTHEPQVVELPLGGFDQAVASTPARSGEPQRAPLSDVPDRLDRAWGERKLSLRLGGDAFLLAGAVAPASAKAP